jgi:aromatic-L-amino-acid decarboxylase
MQRPNESGDLNLTHIMLDGRFVLRTSIGQADTKEGHVARAWELLRELAPQRKHARVRALIRASIR